MRISQTCRESRDFRVVNCLLCIMSGNCGPASGGRAEAKGQPQWQATSTSQPMQTNYNTGKANLSISHNHSTTFAPLPHPLHLPLANASQTNLSTFMRHKSHLIGIFYLPRSPPGTHSTLATLCCCFFPLCKRKYSYWGSRCRRAFILGTKCVLHMRARRLEAGSGKAACGISCASFVSVRFVRFMN